MPGIKGIINKKTKTDIVVIVSNGLKGKPYPITEVIGYNEGFALRYKNSQHKLDTVYIKHDFRMLEMDGKYYLGKRLGNNSGCEIDYEEEKVKEGVEVVGPSTDPNCPGNDLSALVRNDVMAQGYLTLTEDKVPKKLIVIVLIAIAVGLAIYMFIRSRGG